MELLPGKGIGKLLFGMTREEVNQIMTSDPISEKEEILGYIEDLDRYPEEEIAIFYNLAGKVRMIEVVGNDCIYEGIAVNPKNWIKLGEHLQKQDDQFYIDEEEIYAPALELSIFKEDEDLLNVKLFSEAWEDQEMPSASQLTEYLAAQIAGDEEE